MIVPHEHLPLPEDSAFSFDSTSSKYGLYINRQFSHALPVSLNYLANNFQRTGTQPPVAFTLYSAPLHFTMKEVPQGGFERLAARGWNERVVTCHKDDSNSTEKLVVITTETV